MNKRMFNQTPQYVSTEDQCIMDFEKQHKNEFLQKWIIMSDKQKQEHYDILTRKYPTKIPVLLLCTSECEIDNPKLLIPCNISVAHLKLIIA